MRVTAKEEYGLRCILQLASASADESLTAAEIARREALSVPYVEKLLWILKKAGFTKSRRGVKGGYALARPPEQISLGELERVLGGLCTTEEVCDRYTGNRKTCIHENDCALRPIWQGITEYLMGVMDGIPLSQVLRKESLGNESLSKRSLGKENGNKEKLIPARNLWAARNEFASSKADDNIPQASERPVRIHS